MLEEQYLREDVPCGHTSCPICETNPYCRLELGLIGAKNVNSDDMMIAESDEDQNAVVRKTIDKVFIIDHHFALNQIDIIENCDVLSNVVIPDSVLKHLNKM